MKSTSGCAASIVLPSSILVQTLNLGKLPSPIFGVTGIQRRLRRGGQPRARPCFRNTVLTDRPQKHKYQLAPRSASLRKQGMTPLLSTRGRSPYHFSVEFFKKQASPHQNWKTGTGIPSPRFGAGIGNARVVPSRNWKTWYPEPRTWPGFEYLFCSKQNPEK